MIDAIDVDRYLRFGRDEWAELRAQTPLTLHERDLEALRGINDRIDLDEVVAVYLPLTRLLNLYVSATQNLHRVSATFLGTIAPKVPYIIGVAGSVAVGKSTSARILQALLTRWPEHPRVELITTEANEFVSDYFDFSIYLDADEDDIEDWFVERFFALRATVFQNPDSFFRHFAALSDSDANLMAREIWRTINGKNLRENIAPTRSRASLVIHKGSDHRMKEVHLRRL